MSYLSLYPVATEAVVRKIHSVKDLLDHRLIEISTQRNSWLGAKPGQ